MLFRKKKNSPIKVMHYEGIPNFSTDYPCEIEIEDGNFIIKRLKPETTVTLPLERINSFTAMEENRFMVKYHQAAAQTSKSKVGKYYLVVNYDKGTLVFWATALEYGKLLDLQNNTPLGQKNIEL
ncbi:hypothetical protein [uncultured Anaerococcus sp.]|uniref:hypothetical protein n=1 Tax=uncultured Anaerococcus sp. TaxID=293428 RepID=UPI0028041FE6|nr:hypothetical protein [uncultured Anaerococcus sp.]